MIFGRRRLVFVAALAGLVATAVLPAGADPAAEPTNDIEVVASGLDNPRGLALDHRGRIYVAEAGRGGDQLVETPLGDSAGPVCVGMTGRISRIVGGATETVATAPSVAEAVDGACGGPGFGSGATGPHGVEIRRGQLTYSTGLGGGPAPRDLLAAADPGAAQLGLVQQSRGPRSTSFDLVAFEAANDPDQAGVDSNPYGLVGHRGATLATDAGGNSLLRLGRDGSIETAAIFPPLCVPWPFGDNPIPPDQNPCGDAALFPAQAVPTGVAVDRRGNYLVTTLGGFPFVPGQSLVFKIDPRHDGPAVCSTFPPLPAAGCEVFADGLTALVGIDVGRDGSVYVVQFADGGILGAFSGEPGADAGSVQVLHARTGDVVASIDGLTLPGGVAVDRHRVYITNRSVAAGAGEVVAAPVPCHPRHRTC